MITVKWDRERFHISMPPPDTKLGALRRSLAEYSNLPPQNIKLILGGGVMKDDNQPISTYGIRDGATLQMIGHSELPSSKKSPVPSKNPPRPTQHSLVAKIQEEIQMIHHSLVPSLEAFLGHLQSLSPPPAPELEREHIRLGELLLQSLLRLDALTPEGNWEDARLVRKSAVKEVQGLLDKLDGGWQESRNHAVR